MAHYLYLGSKSDALKIDESTNIDQLKEDLRAAAKAGEPFELFAFATGADTPDRVTVNLSAVPWWTVAWADNSVHVF